MEEYKDDITVDTGPRRRPSSRRGQMIFARIAGVVVVNFSLFMGLALTVWGVLSFSSGRYCDGAPGDRVACIDSATYYYYDLWTIVVIVTGVLMITYWKMRDRS